MTDVLDRLRAANPVDEPGSPDTERLRRILDTAPPAPVARRRPRIAARLGIPLAALAAVGLVVGLAGGTNATSVAARAYAATQSADAIDHYVEISRARPAPGAPAFGYTDSRAEVWLAGARSHVVTTYFMVSASGRRSVHHGEDAMANGRRVTYNAESDTIYTSLPALPAGAVAPLRSCATVIVCGWQPADPITTLRRLYRAGRLRDAGATVADGRRLDVLAGTLGRPPGPGTAVRILVDPKTFIPVQVVLTNYGALGRSPVVRLLVTETTTIGGYERIPLTAATSRLLAMRPPPGAHRICALGPPRAGGGLAPC
jgi:hypothetical protein